jgi:succinate dehydrogenase / fumarate reductase flavoprotein subunit
MDPDWRRKLLVCSTEDGSTINVEEKVQPPMRDDLITLFDRGELSKYLTDEEMTEFDGIAKA